MSEENLDGLEAPDNLDTTEVTDTSEAPEAEAPEPEEVKVHPAYEKLLNEIPEAWHEKVKPHLQEQDKNFQQQLEKFSPYKQFVEDGVDANYIEQSIKLAKAIAEDPVSIHTNLTKALMDQGLIRADAEKAAGEIIDENSDDVYEEDGLSPAMKKELDKRDAELREIREQMSKADLDKATEIELGKLNSEFDNLRNSYSVTPQQEQAILELMDVASARGQDLGVFEAAKKLVGLTGTGFKKKGAQPSEPGAPKVLGASGGNGVPFEAVEIPTDARAKKEMLAQMFKDQMAK
jgi:hypothetical protein